jgi:outer membrane protein assembly factor BamE (lipoprotein component of BamABCDE complex)
MSKKRYLAIGALLIVAIALAIGVSAWLQPAPGVTYTNFSRIEVGMLRADVAAILGPPTLGVLNRNMVEDLTIFEDGKELPDSYYWRTDSQDVQVHFDNEDRVTKAYWNGWQDDRSAMEKLRDRLPWIAKDPPRKFTGGAR